MVEPVISAKVRERQGTSASAALRRNGRIPGIVYGAGTENLLIDVDAKDVERLYASGHATGLIALTLGDGAGERRRKVLIKDVQRDFLKGGLKHMDFLEVAMDHPVTTAVPIVIHGEEQRRNQPGVVQHVMHTLEISCLPGEIPEHVIVDVSTLDVGHSIHAGDLSLGRGIKVLTPPEDVVVTIVSPTREKVEEKPEEGVVPDVVGKGKGEEKEAKEA